MMDEYPDKGELVIVSVERVTGYGAFVRLLEYGNKQGMVSLREFSQKWVKNPRDYLKEGQKAVLKVLRVNPGRGHIDMSLKAVNDNERRNKLKAYKLEVRVRKLMEYFSQQFKKTPEELYKLFGDKMVEDYGTLYEAFEAVANDKDDLNDYIKDEKLRNEVVTAIKDNIKPTLVTIKGYVNISSEAGDGVGVVKTALKAGENTFSGDVEGHITYVTPPNYRIDITADDYKTAEKAMKTCYEAIEKSAQSEGVETGFEKKLKKAS